MQTASPFYSLETGVIMNSLRKILLCGLLPLAFAAGSVHAQGGIGHSGMYTMPPNWGLMDKLPPEQRTQAIGIQQKMMQMEMDYQDTVAKMEMKHAHEMMQMQNELLNLYKGH
jgi:hypothetical protein